MSSYSLYRCAVVAISTSSLDLVLERDSPIHILRSTIHIDDQSYSDGLNMKAEQFNEWLSAHPNGGATTEPPDANAILEMFQLLKSQGYHQVIITTPSRKLSNTYHDINQLVPKIAGELEVYLFDNGTLSLPEGFFAQEAVRLLDKDMAPADIITYLEQVRLNSQIIFSIDSLNALAKSRYFNRVGATIADWLNIKPILRFKNGELSRLNTIRSTETALDEIAHIVAAKIKDKNVETYGLYCGNIEQYNQFAEKVYQYSGLQIKGYPISPAASVHIGNNAIGVGIVGKLPLILKD